MKATAKVQQARTTRRQRGARRVVFLLPAVFGLALAVPVAGAQAESLNGALRSAYRYNPQLGSQRATLRATDEGVAQARSGYRPTISGTYQFGISETNTDPGSSSDGRVTPRSFGLRLSQPVFTGFQTRNAVSEAEANVRAGQQTLRSVEQTVLLAAATAYVNVVRDLALVRLRQNNLQFLSRELKATQDRFQVGEVTRTDVAQARARRAAAVSALDLARANLKASRANYRRVVGHEPSGLRAPGTPNRLLPKTLEEAIRLATSQNPSVVGALYLEQSARFAVKRLTGQLLPQVSLNATYDVTRGSSSAISKRETGTITGNVAIPLYEAGRTRSLIRQAKHTHVSRIKDVERARTEARETVVSAWSLLRASLAKLRSDRSQVEANRIALEGVKEEERVGQRTLLDVLDARQELLDAQVSLTVTQRDIIVNAYTLLAAVGRLDMIQMGLTKVVYDPDAHYHEVRRKWFGISITHRDGRKEHINVSKEAKRSYK